MAFKDEINYEKISQINKKERKASKLINLDPEFYLALITHLKNLQDEYNKKHAESPTSTEALLLNNEICKLDSIIKEIYTRRERKILLAALDLGSGSDTNNMLTHEKKLYHRILETLKDVRENILAQKPDPICENTNRDKSEMMQKPDPSPERSGYKNDNVLEAVKNDLEVSSSSEEVEKLETENALDSEEVDEHSESVLVYVLEDLEPFVGTDMITYNLNKEDVATIPRQNAEILKNNHKIDLVRSTY